MDDTFFFPLSLCLCASVFDRHAPPSSGCLYSVFQVDVCEHVVCVTSTPWRSLDESLFIDILKANY